jgi:biopolymer transport protein ExbB/TolQ
MGEIIASFKGEGAMFVWVIFILGCIGVGIVISKIMLIMKAGMGRGRYLEQVYQLIKRGEIEKAIQYSKESKTSLAKLFTAILQNSGKGEKSMNRAVDEVFLTESPRLTRLTPLLSTIANVSTLTGLLGTIFGLIMSFNAVANVPAAQRAQALADGIAVAMHATLLGLFVAIPCLAVYGIIMAQTEKLIEEMDEKAVKMINSLLEAN